MKRTLSRIFFNLMFFGFFLGGSLSILAQPQPLNSVVAMVNQQVITQSQFDTEYRLAQLDFQRAQKPVPTDLKKIVLDHMINEMLQLDVAKQHKISISDAELNKGLLMIASQHHLDLHRLRQAIAKQGWTYSEYTNRIKQEMLLQKVQQVALQSKIHITPEEVAQTAKELQLQQAQIPQSSAAVSSSEGGVASQFHVLEITVPLAVMMNPEALQRAQQQAMHILQQLQQGVPFRSIFYEAKQQPDLRTVDLGWKKLRALSPFLQNIVPRMQNGQVVGPIKAADGAHFIQLLDSRGERRKPGAGDAAAASPKMAMSLPANTNWNEQAQKYLTQKKVALALNDWLKELRQKAYIKIYTQSE